MAALDSISFLLFNLYNELLAIDVKTAVEVIVQEELIPIPGKVDIVKGVFEYRGSYIPVIDTRKKLNMPPSDDNFKGVIIILELNNHQYTKVGIIVDKVHGIHTTQEKHIKPAEGLDTGVYRYIAGLIETQHGVAFVLNAREIFTDSEIIVLNSISKKM